MKSVLSPLLEGTPLDIDHRAESQKHGAENHNPSDKWDEAEEKIDRDAQQNRLPIHDIPCGFPDPFVDDRANNDGCEHRRENHECDK